MASSVFPTITTGVTVQTATSGALTGDGSSGNKLTVNVDGSSIVVNVSNELEALGGAALPADGSVLFVGTSAIDGDATFIWDDTLKTLDLGPTASSFGNGRFLNVVDQTQPLANTVNDAVYIEHYAADAASGTAYGIEAIGGSAWDSPTHDTTYAVGGRFSGQSWQAMGRTTEKVYGVIGAADARTDGTITGMAGLVAELNTGSAPITNLYGAWLTFNKDTPTITNAFGVYVQDVTGFATNGYAFWSDSPGVFRIKDDGVMAYYNPGFTKYTPGATDFERIVQQWATNVAQITTEKGGSGTLRGLTIGASGTVPVSVYGVAPVTRQVFATGAGHTVDQLITVLQNFGIVSQT